ncbi:unnamed protein product [Discula destructiva]
MLPTLSRTTRLVLFACTIGLIILWNYRLPSLCIFAQCPSATITDSARPAWTGSPHHASDDHDAVDLSTADAPFISWPLARLCTETTTWTPGLVFLCDNNSGGIGNIRNFILTCLRYAIAAGAMGMTMPTIQTRSEERLTDLFVGQKVPFSYFFDEEHFRRSMGEACPRVTIYDALEDIPGFARDKEKEEEEEARDRKGGGGPGRLPWEMITPNNFGMRGGCDQRDLNRHADLFGQRFHEWLRKRQEELGLSLGDVVTDHQQHPYQKLIRFNWGVQWTFPVYRDGPEFVATFGGLLRFRADILALAMDTAGVLEQLAGRAGSSFIGMHLRTESDALSGWPSFEEQSVAYLSRAAATATMMGTKPWFAYLATGNATEAARFASRASKEAGLTVVTKHDLLAGAQHGELRRRLDGLSWDQQALVDFVVLLRAEYFLGVSPSSFGMNVALKRHLKREGLYTRPWRVGVDEGDGRSWLVGRYDGYWEDWLFMYESLWP